MRGFGWGWRVPGRPHPDPLYPSQTFHTTLDHPDQFQYYINHPRPCIPMSTHFLTANALHIYQSLQYPSQALHTHLKPCTPISGNPHPTKALDGSYQALQTHSWPLHFSLAIYIHPRPSIPVQGLPYLPQTRYTHPRRSIPIPDVPYPS